MTKYFVKRNYRDTCSSAEMLKGYMLIWWNAERVHIHLSTYWRGTLFRESLVTPVIKWQFVQLTKMLK